jgi:hypothetical protein
VTEQRILPTVSRRSYEKAERRGDEMERKLRNMQGEADRQRDRADSLQARLDSVREWAEGKPPYVMSDASHSTYRVAQQSVLSLLNEEPPE